MTADLQQLALALSPEAALVGGAILALTLDLTAARRRSETDRLRLAVVVGVFAVFVAIAQTLRVGAAGSVFGGVFLLDRLSVATRIGVLLLTQLALVISSGAARVRNPAEYVAMLLFAATGLTLMASVQQLLVAFLAIELASLSQYILAGFEKRSPGSAEAALKYFLMGGIAAAFLLFGFSLVYGLTGSIELPVIARQLSMQPMSPLLVVALVMMVVAFGFKAAAAPFHLWAPDVYQGAPATSAAFIASASKLAGFVFFARLLWTGFSPASGSIAHAGFFPGWLPVLALIALASLLLGNLVALAQTNLRRLLAYSAIAHAGAILIGVIVARRSGAGPLFYYAATYGLATVGLFGVIGVIERTARCDRIADLAGLYRRSPLLALCMFVFVLSLAGIPPLAGFFGKFVVFAAALEVNGLGGIVGWLALAAILLSAVALYYYLVVLKQVLVVERGPDESPIRVPVEAGVALVVCALMLIALGVFPSVVLRMV